VSPVCAARDRGRPEPLRVSDVERGRLEIPIEQQTARPGAILAFVSDLPAIRAGLRELKADVKDLKAIVRGHSKGLTELEADEKDITQIVRGHEEVIAALAAEAHAH
jgi:hypothetical protein